MLVFATSEARADQAARINEAVMAPVVIQKHFNTGRFGRYTRGRMEEKSGSVGHDGSSTPGWWQSLPSSMSPVTPPHGELFGVHVVQMVAQSAKNVVLTDHQHRSEGGGRVWAGQRGKKKGKKPFKPTKCVSWNLYFSVWTTRRCPGK